MCIQQLFGGLRSIFYTPTLISINDIMAWGQGQPPQARLQALLQAPLPELLRYLSGQVLGQARPRRVPPRVLLGRRFCARSL